MSPILMIYPCNLYVSRKMTIVSSIVTKLTRFAEHLATPTVRFEYKLTVGMCLPCETLQGELSKLNQKWRSAHCVLLACSSLQK